MKIDLSPEQRAAGYIINPRFAGDYVKEAARARVAPVCFMCEPDPKLVIWEEDDWYLRINAFPRTTADMMAIPFRHLTQDNELTNPDRIAEGKMKVTAGELLRGALGI